MAATPSGPPAAADDLRWALQAEQLGTGHAVQQAAPGIPDGNQALILYGDVPLLTVATLQTPHRRNRSR